MKLQRLIILAFGAVLIVGAACGSGSGSDESKNASRSSAAGDKTTGTAAVAASGTGRSADCNAMTKDDIESAIGGGFATIQDSSTGGTIICTTNRENDAVSVQYTIKPTSAGEFEPTIEYSKKSGAAASAVSGIGDKAMRLVTEKYGVRVVQVIAVKGNAMFYVTMSAQDGAISDQAEGLAKTLAARL